MARISLDPPRSLTSRMTNWYSRRSFGKVMEPARAMAHDPKLLRTVARFEMGAEKWKAAPDDLKRLAVMAAAGTVGCEWCMDFGYWITMNDGVDPQKVRDVPRWRESTAYTDVERVVLELAEAASSTPMLVTDDLIARLQEHLDDAAIVEIAMMIGIENQRARFNSALGLADQCFADSCEVKPLPAAR